MSNAYVRSNTKALLDEDLSKGKMPIFGIPLLGFSDYDPRFSDGNQIDAMKHWHEVSQSKWRRMAYHVLSPQHKDQGSVIRQMLRQFWKNEIEAEVLQEDFMLGVNLSEREKYRRIIEKNGDFVCIRNPENKDKETTSKLDEI